MIRAFLLINIIFLTSVYAGVKDYNMINKSKAVNSYFILKEKNKVEYLNNILKISLTGVLNTSYNNNLFNVNNTRISDLSVDKIFTKNEEFILNKMDEIASKIIIDDNTETIYCSALESHYLNEDAFGDKYFTIEQCSDMNYKLIYFYESNGPFSINIPIDGILNENTSKFIINLDDIELHINKIKSDIKYNNKISENIRFYDKDLLAMIVDDINKATNKSYICKTEIKNSIILRAEELKIGASPTEISNLNDINTSANDYNCNNHKYISGLIPVTKTLMDRRAYLNMRIDLYTITIIPGVQTKYNKKIIDLDKAKNPPPPSRPNRTTIRQLEDEVNILFEKVQSLNMQKQSFVNERDAL